MTFAIEYHQCRKCAKQYLTLRGIVNHIKKKHPEQKLDSGYTTLQQEPR